MKYSILTNLFIASLLLTLFACGNQKLEHYQFLNETITLPIPKNYKPIPSDKISSLYSDKLDDVKYSVLVSSFYDLQRGDQTLDILKDEKSKFHYLLLLNSRNSPVFNEMTFNKLKSAQAHQYDLIMDADATIKIELFDSKFEDLGEMSVVMMKHKFIVNNEDSFYKTVFFINKSGETVIAHELNLNELDSEEFLKGITIP